MDPNRAELLDKIKAQGDVVRKLKEQKAEKVMVRIAKLFLPFFKITNVLLLQTGFLKIGNKFK